MLQYTREKSQDLHFFPTSKNSNSATQVEQEPPRFTVGQYSQSMTFKHWNLRQKRYVKAVKFLSQNSQSRPHHIGKNDSMKYLGGLLKDRTT